MAGYVGNIPVPQSVREDQSFTATAGQTTFNTLGYTDGNRIKVTLNGVLLEGGGVDYTATNGSDVVLTVAAVVDDIVRFETFNEVQLVSNTSTTPIIKTNLTLKNDTHEDTDGGRESTVIFSGEQSGGEITTLAEIEASHDGTADDQKGDLIFRTNDGSDGTSPTERLRIDSDGSIVPATLGTDNVHLGEGAGASLVSGGTNNVVIGKNAGTAITTGDDNVAIGHQALDANTTGIKNVSVGSSALTSNVTGNDNTAVGHQALQANTGNDNTAVGWGALYTNTSAAGNTAVGRKALYSNTTGDQNVAIGYQAGEKNTTGLGNTSIGYQAGNKITSGNNNTAIGRNALDALTTGGANTAVGREALTKVTTGAQNTALGLEAGKELTTGTFNVALGWSALKACTTGDQNVAVGSYSQLNSVGEYNTTVGEETMINSTSGDYNTAIGYKALEDMTSSSDFNTAIGGFAGNDVASGAVRNVFVGYNTGTGDGANDNQIVIGSDCTSVGGGYITLGNNSGGRVYNHPYSNATWTRTSDERIKKDIQTNSDCGLDFINDLRTVTYKWKAPSEHPEEFKSYNADITESSYTEKMYGFIAQEVKAAMDTHNITDFAGWHTVVGNGDQQGISYEMFVMPLVKAVQELSAKNDALEAQNTTQATQIADLITRVTALEAE